MRREAEARGLKVMVGCMLSTSLGIAPAFLAAQGADWVDLDGPVWAAAFAAWHIVPGLARPMLRWRRRAHARGNTQSFASFFTAFASSGAGPGALGV